MEFNDADGDGAGAATLSRRYLHGPAVDQVLASEDFSAGTVNWALADEQGTIRDVARYSGATTTIVTHRKFDAFGNLTSETNPGGGSPVPFLFSFTGREWDADAEMYHYRARWYDARVGRFASEDPIGFSGGDTNLNRYVGNSPVNGRDPSGLDWRTITNVFRWWAGETAKDLANDESDPVRRKKLYDAAMNWQNQAISDNRKRVENTYQEIKEGLTLGSGVFGTVAGAALMVHGAYTAYCTYGYWGPAFFYAKEKLEDMRDALIAQVVGVPEWIVSVLLLGGGSFRNKGPNGTGTQQQVNSTVSDVAPNSGKVWQDFLPEAEARLAAAKAKYGDGAVMMALSRKQALSRLEGLEGAVLYHLDDHIPATIGKSPTAVSHWRKEVGGFLDEMERMTPHIGKKSAADWQGKINTMRQRLIDLLGEE